MVQSLQFLYTKGHKIEWNGRGKFWGGVAGMHLFDCKGKYNLELVGKGGEVI